MPNTYYPNKDADFIAWLTNFLNCKARKGGETSGSSVYAGGEPIPPSV